VVWCIGRLAPQTSIGYHSVLSVHSNSGSKAHRTLALCAPLDAKREGATGAHGGCVDRVPWLCVSLTTLNHPRPDAGLRRNGA